MALIKAAKPDAVIAWAAGTPAGTLFRGLQDAGIDVPTLTSSGNLTAAFFKQYASLVPKNLYFAGVPYYSADTLSDPATKSAIATMVNVLATIGMKPDQLSVSAWDPGMLLVEALRKLGVDASAAKLRVYVGNQTGWVGVNGRYDFRAFSQRGLGQNNITMVKWDAQRNAAVGMSKFGGVPLPGK